MPVATRRRAETARNVTTARPPSPTSVPATPSPRERAPAPPKKRYVNTAASESNDASSTTSPRDGDRPGSVNNDVPRSRHRLSPREAGRKAPTITADEIEALTEAQRRRVSARFHARLRGLKRRVADLATQFPTSDAVLLFSNPLKRRRMSRTWCVLVRATPRMMFSPTHQRARRARAGSRTSSHFTARRVSKCSRSRANSSRAGKSFDELWRGCAERRSSERTT
mmetsp:Transcript_4966/g.19080  ORF Transcript_4966/g.19080 Transcript_4966/m.19080 type:complete len:225 (+) Transcript_4966:797-1471(+)